VTVDAEPPADVAVGSAAGALGVLDAAGVGSDGEAVGLVAASV
jgi:hypothetical protein